MADGTITIDINANENVGDKLNKVKQDAEGLDKSTSSASTNINALGSSLKKLATIGTVVAVTKQLYDFTKSCVKAYGEFEQLEGGIQQLFGKDAPKVLENASKSFKTAQTSMNDYLNIATSFSAKLINDFKGNTAMATEYIDKALIQMSDNANTFGTNIEDIQRAYQGFAKENYTMLDNLKLGYSGTKQGMEELLADAEKLSGQKFEMGNLGDMIDAIGIVQDKLNITGKTALESATTIEGSVNTMKASWENFKVAVASGIGMEEATSNLVQSVGTVIDNVTPVVGQIADSITVELGKQLANADWVAIGNKITEGLRNMGEPIAEGFAESLSSSLDKALSNTVIGDKSLYDWLVGDKSEAETVANDFMANLSKEFGKAGGQYNDIVRTLNQQLTDALTEATKTGDYSQAKDILTRLNDELRSQGSKTQFQIDAEGELVVTNTAELRKQASQELKNIISEKGIEAPETIEKAVDFVIKAKNDGKGTDVIQNYLEGLGFDREQTIDLLVSANVEVARVNGDVEEMTAQQLMDKYQMGSIELTEKAVVTMTAEYLEGQGMSEAERQSWYAQKGFTQGQIDQIESTLGVTMSAEVEDNATSVLTSNEEKIAHSVDAFARGYSVNKTVTANANANVQTGQALATIDNNTAKLEAQGKKWSNPLNLGQKNVKGTAGATINISSAISSIQSAFASIKSKWNSMSGTLGTKSVTGSIVATITTTMKQVVNVVKQQGMKASEGFFRALGKAPTGGSGSIFSGSTTINGTDGLSEYIQSLQNAYDTICTTFQQSADRLTKTTQNALDNVTKSLNEGYKELEAYQQRQEEYNKRSAQLNLEDAQSKLGSGKTDLENRKLQLAYEEAQDRVYELSDAYKELVKAQEEEKKQQEELQDKIKETQDTYEDVQKNIDQISKDYANKLSSYSSYADLSESYNKQNRYVKDLEKLPDLLNKLRDKGMPDELIQNILKMNPSEAVALCNKYLNMRDNAYQRYISLWSRSESASVKLGEVDLATSGKTEEYLEEICDQLTRIGDDLATPLVESIENANQTLGIDLKLNWSTMTGGELAKVLMPMIEAEQQRL